MDSKILQTPVSTVGVVSFRHPRQGDTRGSRQANGISSASGARTSLRESDVPQIGFHRSCMGLYSGLLHPIHSVK